MSIFASYNQVEAPDDYNFSIAEPEEDEIFYTSNPSTDNIQFEEEQVENPITPQVTAANPPKVYNDDNLDIEDLLRSEGITSINGKKIRFGDRNLRAANASYGSKNSHHKRKDPFTGYASARDISIVGGTDADYTEFRRLLLNNDRIKNYMSKKKWGIINELTPQVLSKTRGTGRHFHFGPDQWATRTWAAWLNNPNLTITQYIS